MEKKKKKTQIRFWNKLIKYYKFGLSILISLWVVCAFKLSSSDTLALQRRQTSSHDLIDKQQIAGDDSSRVNDLSLDTVVVNDALL